MYQYRVFLRQYFPAEGHNLRFYDSALKQENTAHGETVF